MASVPEKVGQDFVHHMECSAETKAQETFTPVVLTMGAFIVGFRRVMMRFRAFRVVRHMITFAIEQL